MPQVKTGHYCANAYGGASRWLAFHPKAATRLPGETPKQRNLICRFVVGEFAFQSLASAEAALKRGNKTRRTKTQPN